MARKFKITEEQREMLIKEGVNVIPGPDNYENGKLYDAAKNASNDPNISKMDITIKPSGDTNNQSTTSTTTTTGTTSTTSGMSESKTFTMKELREARIKKLKECGTHYTVKDFVSKK